MNDSMSITINDTTHTSKRVEVDGAKWFRGNGVAQILKYARPSNAIIYHVPHKLKKTI